MVQHYDVIIVGAGISGINAAYYIQNKCKDKTYALLEGRSAIGGTWDLFKYPGIRSDSDMYTLGFPFYPWKNPKAIADAEDIKAYIHDTCQHFGFDQHLQLNRKVTRANWSDIDKRWELIVENGSDGPEAQSTESYSCNFLYMCSGYYNYESGYLPQFEGRENFEGAFLHPQHWDESLDYKDKRVVIIGSGATAVTMGPNMARKAKKVYILQRSPTYIVGRPSEDKLANFLLKILPDNLAHNFNRLKNILVSMFFFNFSKAFPNKMKSMIKNGTKKFLGKHYKEEDFTPKYKPWDERLCLAPDGDFFEMIKAEKLELITDHIDHFDKTGILLKSGKKLDTDIIVSATGLQMQLFGGMQMLVNGKAFQVSQKHMYKGVLIEDLPNFATAIGYTNASWTLKCDLNSRFVARLINLMEAKNYKTMYPQFDNTQYHSENLLNLNSGYIERTKHLLPKSGNKNPWKVYQNYFFDLFTLKYARIKNKAIKFEN